MPNDFAGALRRLRSEKNLSQQQLADLLFVDRSTVASWESGRRLPTALMISRISQCLEINASVLLDAAASESTDSPNVILVDDEPIVLNGGLPILREVLPQAVVTGFAKPSAALEFASSNRVPLAFLDIEMGKFSGLDLCRELLKVNPRTNVVFLTAYPEYSLEAWDLGASGFLLKPLSPEAVRRQLSLLRHPERGLMLHE